MGLHDLPFVVQTHYHYFPHSFFARLGPRFMTRYYRTFLDGPLAVAIVIERDDVVSGYLVGVLIPPRHRKLLMQHHGIGLAAAAAIALITRPRLAVTFLITRLGRYLRAMRRARSSRPTDTPTAPLAAVLSHVAVAPSSRCQGLGTLLTEEFIRQAKEAGCARACLVTAPGERGAGAFYERRNWHQHMGHLTPDDQALLRFEMSLAPTTNNRQEST